jgi:hypothetical protein
MWWMIAVWVITAVVSTMLAPKPKAPAAGTFDVPTVTEGAPIGVLYGSGWVTSPIIGWWGDTRTVPIRKKGKK